MQKVRRHTLVVLRQLVCICFQVLFHFPPGILFTFPSRYLFSIGQQRVFSLGRWSSQIPTGFLVSRGTQVSLHYLAIFRIQDFHLLRFSFPTNSPRFLDSFIETLQPRNTCISVWAPPRSLAATYGIILIFFSSGYLDGSVLRVRLLTLCIQIRIPPKRWVAPFGYPRVYARLAARRGFSQPSTSFFACCCLGIQHIHLIFYRVIYFFFKTRVGSIPNFPFSFFNELSLYDSFNNLSSRLLKQSRSGGG